MRVRLWCDQTAAVPIEDVTFGVRYICELQEGFGYGRWSPTAYKWRRSVQVYRDGERLVPRWDGLGPSGHAPLGRSARFELGQALEHTFTLADAVELDQVTAGRYVIFATLGSEAVTQAVEFDVWDDAAAGEPARLVAKVTAQGLKPSNRPRSAPFRRGTAAPATRGAR